MPMPAATLTRRMPHYRLSPPTLSGVNCKRDRVAVDLPVSWRCRRGGCKRDRVAVDLPVPWRCWRGMPMPAATLTRRMPHYRLSPPTLSGVNCKRDRVAVDLPVPWRCWRGGCQRRRSRGACRTIACPPTLSGVNCKRDRVAVDLPVSWRCWRGGCKRDRVAVEKPQ